MSYRFYTKPSELWARLSWDKGNQSPVPAHDPNNHGEDDEEAFEE
jgi:hypothetical protein